MKRDHIEIPKHERSVNIILPTHGYDDNLDAYGSILVSQTFNLLEGWNWISINLAIEDQDAAVAMLDQLKEQLGDNAEQIQSFEFTTEYQGDLEWFGDLETFVPGQGYMYLSKSDTVKYLVFKTGAKSHYGNLDVR